MLLIKSLHQFLVEIDLVAAEQISSWVDELTVTPSGRPGDSAGQVLICDLDYLATFEIQRFPHGKTDPQLLMAQVSAWLLQNDTGRVQPVTMEWVVDVIDAKTADIEFSMPFNEPVLIDLSSTGPVELDDARYALA